jgi:hypothetical protein
MATPISLPPDHPHHPSPRRLSSTVEVKNGVTQVTTEHQLGLQKQIITFLLKAYGSLLTAAMVIFFLQRFKLGGFHLEADLIKWLGGETAGAVAGLLTLTFGAVFKRNKSD